MNITFDLKEAVVYLPSGKLMNMKDKLSWNSLELTPEQIQEALKSVENEHFKMNLSFEKLEGSLTQDFMNEQSYQRTELYKNLTISRFEKLDYLKVIEDRLSNESLESFASLGESILKDKRVSEKLQKLDRLKLINS